MQKLLYANSRAFSNVPMGEIALDDVRDSHSKNVDLLISSYIMATLDYIA